MESMLRRYEMMAGPVHQCYATAPFMLTSSPKGPKRQRLNPQADLPHGIAAPHVLPEQLISPDHDIPSVRHTAATAASAKPASRAAVSDQATRPPSRGQPSMSDRHRKGSTASQTKRNTQMCPKRVSSIKTLDTNDLLHQTTRKLVRSPGTCQDDLRIRWRLPNEGGRGRT
jgi:hypothetical protein